MQLINVFFRTLLLGAAGVLVLVTVGPDPAAGQLPPGTASSPWVRGDRVPEPPAASREFSGIIIRSGVNVRSGPGFHCDVIDRFSLGSEVTVYRKVGPWYEVDLDDRITGWLASRYVQKKTGISPPSSGVTRELSAFGITIEAEPVPAALRGDITGNRVNVREEPSRDGAFVTKVSRGQDVEILEETGAWSHVRLVGDRCGWVFDELVQEKANILGTVTGNGVNVRAEGGIYFDVVTKVYRDMKLPIIDKKGEWFQVVLPDGKVGWIIERYCDPPPPAGATTEPAAPVDEGEELLLELEFK